MATSEKMSKRRRRRKAERDAVQLAFVVNALLGGILGALQLQEAVPRWSLVPAPLFLVAHLAAVLLITASLAQGVRTGLLSGVIAAITQFLTLMGVYTYSYGITAALYVAPLDSLRVLTYPAAGVIGGYIGGRIAGTRNVKSRPTKRTDL